LSHGRERLAVPRGVTYRGDPTVPTIGSHWILEMYECPPAVIDDLEHVRGALREAAKAARSTLLHEAAHAFAPQGVTALGLLAESHISVHTWPELGYAAADVFTCGEHATPKAACEQLAAALKAGRWELRHIERGAAAPAERPLRQPEPLVAATEALSSDRRDAG
jgi:S-adenosylmethionine decarboxylase